jgi:hypothetical protein
MSAVDVWELWRGRGSCQRHFESQVPWQRNKQPGAFQLWCKLGGGEGCDDHVDVISVACCVGTDMCVEFASAIHCWQLCCI